MVQMCFRLDNVSSVYGVTCINTVLQKHGWQNNASAAPKEPLHPDSAHEPMATVSSPDLESLHALEAKHDFSCCQLLGETIFAMVVGCVDITEAVSLLSTRAADPADCHFVALKQTWKWLCHHKERGLICCQLATLVDLHVGPDKVEFCTKGL